MSSEESRILIFEGSLMDAFENNLPPISVVVTDQMQRPALVIRFIRTQTLRLVCMKSVNILEHLERFEVLRQFDSEA